MIRSVTINNGTGRDLAGILTLPAGEGPFPGLIIAPGSNYPKEGHIIERLTAQAVAAGWATLAFDWSYTTYGGSPSSGRKREIMELNAALAFLKAEAKVDSSRLVVAGKSLGSAVAYAVFAEHEEIVAALLFTPVFRTAEGAERAYGGLASEPRPVHLLTGKSDPLNNLAVMEAHLNGAGSHIVTTVIRGDHGLNVTRKKDADSQATNRTNIESGIEMVAAWLKGL